MESLVLRSLSVCAFCQSGALQREMTRQNPSNLGGVSSMTRRGSLSKPDKPDKWGLVLGSVFPVFPFFGNIFSCFGEFTMGHQGGHQSILPQATSWLELAYCDHCGRQLAEAADQLGVGFPIDLMFSNGCHVICQETISRQFCCVRFWENTTLRSPRSRSTSEHVGARRVCSSCKRKEYVLPASCLTCRAVPATCAWYSACPNFCFQEVTKLEIHTSRHQVSPWFQHVSTLHSEF